MENYVVTCAPGLEKVLAEEITELGLKPEPAFLGSINLSCSIEDALRVAFHSRIASKMLMSLKVFSAKNADMLYDQIRRIRWPNYFNPEQTFVIHSHGVSVDGLKISFASLKIKDAICDEFKKLGFERPNVDRQNPDIRIEAFFANGKCEVSLDLFGEALHRRSFKEENAEAPLKENKAAALLRFAGYDGSTDFYDPFCGSGTIVSEAAMIALNIPPGLARSTDPTLAFHLFPQAKDYWATLIRDAKKNMKASPSHKIIGCDKSVREVRVCLENMDRLKLGKHVKILQQDALKIDFTPSVIASNPPFGDRLLDEKAAADLLTEFCSRVKHNAKGSRLALFLKKGPLEKAPGLRTKRKMSLQNGPFEARFLVYELF